MSDWRVVSQRLLEAGERCVLVTVAETAGSAPRDAGAKMVVSADQAFATIGGGHLEFEAIRRARQMLTGGEAAPQLERFALGPSLGQCCGGSATLLFEPLTSDAAGWLATLADAARDGQPAVLISWIDPRPAKLVVTSEPTAGGLADLPAEPDVVALARCMLAEAAPEARLLVSAHGRMPILLEPFAPARLRVVLFGAGHVGRALVHVLGELPCRVLWVDGRRAQFPERLPANTVTDLTELPERAVDRAPPGAAFLVMTHSHALDLQICERILRRGEFTYCGLIGSATKRAKFEKRLRARGIPAASLARLVCPIGIAGIHGKHPGAIAVAVAAQLLLLDADRERACGTPRVAEAAR